MRLSDLAIRHPAATLALAAAVTAAAVPGLLRLELRTDGRALVPETAPAVVFDRKVRELFDVRDPIVVVLRSDHADGIFNPETLLRVEKLTVALRDVADIRPFHVTSLATEPGFRHRPGTLRYRNLIEPVPESAAQIAELRDDLRRIEIYDGTLVSSDGSATAILIGTPPAADRRKLIREIRGIVASETEGSGDVVEVLGAPVAESLLGSHILADLGVPPSLLADGTSRGGMVPIAIAVMAIVFLVAFRRLAAALLPLTEIAVCLLIVFGVMGWLGVPVYLTIAVLPVILTAVGAADEIHIFRRYLDLGPDPAAGPDAHRDLVRRTMEEMTSPVARTSVTTAVAFLSFALSPMPPVRAFGLLTAFGVMLCMVFSLTVIPALLVLLGPQRWVGRRWLSAPAAPSRVAAALARLASRRRWAVLGIAAGVAVVAVDGVRRVEVQDSWVDGFAPNSAFARATRWFDDQFLGSHLLRLVVETEAPELRGEVTASALGAFELTLDAPADVGPARLYDATVRIFNFRDTPKEWRTWCDSVRIEADRWIVTMPRQRGSARAWLRPQPDERVGYEISSRPLTSPVILDRIARLEEFLAQLPGVGGVLGPARYLRTVGFMVRPDVADSRRLPSDPRDARNRWSNYRVVRGEDRLRQLVDGRHCRALVSVYLKDASYADTDRLMKGIRTFERENLSQHGIRLDFAGDVAVSQALIDAVTTTQVRSLLLSLLGILIVAGVLGRSLRWGVLSVLPPAFAVLVSFAAMGWLGIPLGVATSMFAGMTLGVGVDFAIHLLARYERTGSVEEALAIAGPAILIDALAVGLGFGMLVLSQVPSNARLGGLLMAAVLGCLLATCLLAPAALRSSPYQDG